MSYMRAILASLAIATTFQQATANTAEELSQSLIADQSSCLSSLIKSGTVVSAFTSDSSASLYKSGTVATALIELTDGIGNLEPPAYSCPNSDELNPELTIPAFDDEAWRKADPKLIAGDHPESPVERVNEWRGYPAATWFGPNADSTFLSVDSSMQIILEQDSDQVMLEVQCPNGQGLGYEEQIFEVTVFDAAGDEIAYSEAGFAVQDPPGVLGSLNAGALWIASSQPFRSLIISHDRPWLAANIRYLPEAGAAESR